MPFVAEWILRVCLAAITILGVLWIFNVPFQLGWSGILQEQFYLLIAGLVTGAGFIHAPFGRRAGWSEAGLAIIAVLAWGWAAYNFPEWVVLSSDRGAERWVPGLIALVLLLLSTYQNVGAAVTLTMSIVGLYGFVGHWFPGVLEGQYTEPRRMIMYLYSDSNGVPGLVLGVATTVVLAFIIFSKALETAGAAEFFDKISIALLGTHRGGSAKVAVGSSALFGIVSGSAVANVVSSGIVTIPMMIRAGFRPSMAAGIEATSSTVGQITPPVMGATAFLIAEFLQIPYTDVVIAAAVPAAIFYFVLYLQVDTYAARLGLVGLPRDQVPRVLPVLREGSIFILPILVLIYFMFWEGTRVEVSAIYSAACLLALGVIKRGEFAWGRLIEAITVGVGKEMIPILLVSAAAGIVIGSLNISGLAFTITLILTQVGANAGIFAMLLLTAVIALVLGMGLPTSAVYVLLSVVLAPALVKMGIYPLAAHMFIFYLGMMSFLTPPVAMSSYTAAALAKTDLWTTSVDALRIGAAGYFLPFMFALNPALILHGSVTEIFYAVSTVVLSGAYLAFAAESAIGAVFLTRVERPIALVLALVIGSSTVWLGSDTPLNLAVLAAGCALMFLFRRFAAERKSVPI